MTQVSLSKIEELEINRIVAPSVRHADKRKRFKTLDSQGRPTGRTVSHVEIVEKQFLREGIEITRDPKKGVRPQALYCKDCGVPFKVPKKGLVLSRCARCDALSHRCTKVVDGARCAARTCARHRRCADHKATKGEMRERARALNASLTPEQRRDISRKGAAALTPEQREQCRERARRMNASLTPEQRRDISRKGAAALTTEQRRDSAMKANAARWTARRAKQKAEPS